VPQALLGTVREGSDSLTGYRTATHKPKPIAISLALMTEAARPLRPGPPLQPRVSMRQKSQKQEDIQQSLERDFFPNENTTPVRRPRPMSSPCEECGRDSWVLEPPWLP
jgi:hypothetical protein